MVTEQENDSRQNTVYVREEIRRNNNNNNNNNNNTVQEEGKKYENLQENNFIYTSEIDLIPEHEHYALPSDVIKKFVSKVRRQHPLRIAWVFLLIILVTSGNAMQIIGLNFWLRHFPKDGAPGNYTTLAVSALLFGIFFLIFLIIYIIIRRPSLTFALNLRGWWLIFLIGLMDAINSSMAIYAASYTPEVLQALFTSLVPIYAAGFTKWILKDPRKYLNWWIASSFFLIISGVLVASAHQFAHELNGSSGNKAWWNLIFFLSVPPTVLMNIWQSLYMIEFTYDPNFEETLALQTSSSDLESNLNTNRDFNTVNNNNNNNNNNNEINSYISRRREVNENQNENTINYEPLNTSTNNSIPSMQGGDTIVKLVMLAGETNIQFLIILLSLPTDALPWWGGSNSVEDAWANFSEGITCIFNCNNNYIFCMIYTAGFVFTYIGSAYLNQYSVTLCSMIGQLSSPFTALLLIIVPSWNLEKGYTPWYMSLLAVFLLCTGSFIYAMWEEFTDEEKLRGERRLKKKLLTRMYYISHSLNISSSSSSTQVE